MFLCLAILFEVWFTVFKHKPLFCRPAEFGGCHGVLVAEDAGKSAAVGEAALLGDEAHGIVGRGEQ
jgi:hypothetical protein